MSLADRENDALKRALATAQQERDLAEARRQQLVRVLAGTATTEDAVELLSCVLVQDAVTAPNCAEWRGSYGDRAFVIAVQWVDGKSPHALINEARSERDALRAELDAIRGTLDGTVVPPREETLARRVYETAQLAADFAADLSALYAKVTP